MPLKLGTKNIGAIYKGTTPISAIYKGTTLVYSSFVWCQWYQEFVYNSLVPTQVNKNTELPFEYQQVEYIESTGTQYIDSGVKPTQNTNFEITFAKTENIGTQYLFGVSESDNIRVSVRNSSNEQLAWYYGNDNSSDITPLLVNTKYTVKNEANNLYLNGSSVYSTTTKTFSCTINSYLFGRNLNGSISNNAKIKLYSHKISQGTTLVRNFIPCYRKSDNVIGLYDSVNGVFYTNAGTGTFSKGADVNRNVLNKAKVSTIYGNSVVVNQLQFDGDFSSTGTHYFDVDGGTKQFVDNTCIATFNGNANTNFRIRSNYTTTKFNIINGHIYLFKAKIKSSVSLTNFYFVHYFVNGFVGKEYNGTLPANTWAQDTIILTANANATNNVWLGISTAPNTQYPNGLLAQGDTLTFAELQVVDLTQMFPFNTPTTADTRVQALINRGYITYNTGTLKNVDMSEISSALLPDTFQELDYIESTGTQYIDTNFKPNQDTRVLIKAKTDSSISTGYRLFGASSNYDKAFYISNSSALYWYINYGNRQEWYAPPTITADTEYEIDFNKNKVYINNELYGTLNQTTFTCDYNAILFGANMSGTIVAKTWKVYSCKIWDNGTLIRNFIPAKRKSDNEIGLYDIVNQVFYTNAGTGSFVAGNEVNSNEHSITLKYQGSGVNNSHDTMTIDNDNVVFRKDRSRYTFTGSETWTDILASRYSCSVISSVVKKPSVSSDIANILCPTMTPSKSSNVETIENGIAIQTIGNIVVHSSSITDTATAQSYMTGKTIEYQLATPQVITIPRKHIGVVDLGTLDWSVNPNYSNVIRSNGVSSTIKTPPNNYTRANVSCLKYMTTYFYSGGTGVVSIDKSIAISGGYININDSELVGLTNAQIQAKLSGQYLYYETTNESTIPNIIDIQSGGTITTNSEILPNIDFLLKAK